MYIHKEIDMGDLESKVTARQRRTKEARKENETIDFFTEEHNA